MKILKPGKVEQRKFVCPNCECEFVIYKSEANRSMDLNARYHYWATCPCRDQIAWDKGKPYEEPTQDTEADAKKIVAIAQQWLRDDRTASLWTLADKLIANGVTFREV